MYLLLKDTTTSNKIYTHKVGQSSVFGLRSFRDIRRYVSSIQVYTFTLNFTEQKYTDTERLRAKMSANQDDAKYDIIIIIQYTLTIIP